MKSSLSILGTFVAAMLLAAPASADSKPAEAHPPAAAKPATQAKPAPKGKSAAPKPAASAISSAAHEPVEQVMVPVASNAFWPALGAAPAYMMAAPAPSYAVTGAGGEVVNISFQTGFGVPVAAPAAIAVPMPISGGIAPVGMVQGYSIQAPVVPVSARVIPTGSVWQPNGLSGYPGQSSAFLVGATGMTHKLDVASPILATAPVANPYTIRQ